MSKEIGPYSEITKRDLAKGRNLAIAAAASPFVLGGFLSLIHISEPTRPY